MYFGSKITNCKIKNCNTSVGGGGGIVWHIVRMPMYFRTAIKIPGTLATRDDSAYHCAQATKEHRQQ